MPNTILTPTMIARKALAILHNKLTFLKTINREYDSQFAQRGAKIGDTLKIRKPAQFTVRTGLTMSTQDFVEESTDLVVATVKGVDVNFSSVELTLSIDDFGQRVLEPMMSRLAAEIESYVLSQIYSSIYNFTGIATQTPSSMSAILNAGVKLSQNLAPLSDRHLLVDSVTMASMVSSLSTLFHKASELERAFSQGYYGEALGFKWWESNMIPNHTNGSRDDVSPVVDTSAIVSGTPTISMTGLDAGATINKGDVFTIAGVYAVNPETKQRYSSLQQFVCTANVAADGVGNATVPVSPIPITSGPRQNCEIVNPGAGKAVVFEGLGGSGPANAVIPQPLAYHRDAFTFVTADLEQPKNVEAAREVYDGISISYVRGFDITKREHPARIDVLFGFAVVRPEWAVRVRG